MHKIDLTKNKAFCILPFVHLHVNEKNDVKLCCIADNKGVKKYTKDFDFENDPDMQEIRAKILAGERVDHCANCYEFEDGGADSSRLRDTEEWQRKLSLENYEDVKTDLVYYDIRNDNLCNLSCRMCNPQFSSQLAKEFKIIGWGWEDEPKSFGFNDVVDLSTVKKIYVAGGEPSLMPEFRTFLKRAIEAGRTDIEIRMNTNATNLNKEYRQLLSQFKNLNIVVSLDGYDQINRYIRWPADWNTIVENVHGIRQITPNLAFNVTVSIWNISNLSLLINFLDREFPDNIVLLNKVMYPPHQEFTAFPDRQLVLADLNLLTQSPRYTKDMSFKGKVDYYISEMQSAPVDLDALREFFKYNDTLDNSRNIKLIDYIPELEQCRDYINGNT
jgi:sulfatase maturation enzyme AslB (radical SAM superfamily)